MKAPHWLLVMFLCGVSPWPVAAGSLSWTPGGSVPVLELTLGDGVVKRSLELTSGVVYLDLIIKKDMAPSNTFVVTWTNNGKLWMRQLKKIPGSQASLRMPLPPGPAITLEVSTSAQMPMAVIKLRRN